jgi:hypothetical protein
MENPPLYPYVLERFPERSERILQLLERDADFDEICSDYEELANWLAAHSHDGCTSESALAKNRHLLEALAEEILEALQAAERQSGRLGRWYPRLTI